MTVLRDDMGREVTTAAGKWIVGPGAVIGGVLTMNDVALIFGALCSAVIIFTTLARFYWDWRDRKRTGL